MPTWIFWLPVHLFGATAWITYVAGALCTLVGMALMWRLLKQLRGRRYATVALLAALCITYYNGRLNYYNHNVVLMLFAAAIALLCWQAFSTGLARWWLALGIALGLGALTKYEVAVSAACVIIFWLQQRGWRVLAHRRGLLVAALAALLIFVPHIAWLRQHDFAPVQYAMESSLGLNLDLAHRASEAFRWLADQLFNRALPAWILLALVALAGTRKSRHELSGRQAGARGEPDAARVFLLIWGLVPLAFVPAVCLLYGAHLPFHWATPFLFLAVPAVMELVGTGAVWRRIPPRPLWLSFVSIQILLLSVNWITSPLGPKALRDDHRRAFESAGLARTIEGPARAILGGRICVVSGPSDIAGVLAYRLTDQPLVLIDGRFDRSPWVRRRLVDQCGELQIREAPASSGWNAVGPTFPGISWRVEQPARQRPAQRPPLHAVLQRDRAGL